ncbi:hypothetical protein CB1_000507015 [Camelus ferus]|nr:hypothetical protein CB1_000507015 [Camelus ferus]
MPWSLATFPSAIEDAAEPPRLFDPNGANQPYTPLLSWVHRGSLALWTVLQDSRGPGGLSRERLGLPDTQGSSF